MKNLNELIPIEESNGKKAVNARDLHAFLESKQDFSTWIKARIDKYDFIENQDYQVLHNFVEQVSGTKHRIDYALTISMAKELSMIESNEQGKQARKYFIACEKIATEKPKVPQTYIEALEELVASEKQKQIIEEEKRLLEVKNAKLQPKADFADVAFKADGKVDIGQAAKILGLPFGRNTLFKKLKEIGVFFTSRNEPKQKYIDAKYFELTQLPPIHRSNHPDIITMKVICTQKGLAYINHLFGGNPPDGRLSKIK